MNFERNGLIYRSYNTSSKDKEFIDELASDLKVRQYISNIKKKNHITNSFYNTPFIVSDIDTLEDIGYVYFYEPYLDTLDLVYAIHPEHRMLGYGTRMVDGACDFILNKEESIDMVSLIINPSNEASIATALSSGFERVGNIRYERGRKR